MTMTLVEGGGLGLNVTGYSYYYNMDERASGDSIVSGGDVGVTFNDDGDPVFEYIWAVGDTAATGAYNCQFKVVRDSDNAPMFEDIFLIWIYPAI